jgi:hypothetical protein
MDSSTAGKSPFFFGKRSKNPMRKESSVKNIGFDEAVRHIMQDKLQANI